MPYQYRYQVINLPVNDASGNPLDASTLTAAEYAIFDCNNVKKVDKTIANGGLTVAVLDGVNILTCELTAEDTKHLCGQVSQEFKVATTGEEFLGVVLSSPKINFIKTRI
jgi:hypothetical protein